MVCLHLYVTCIDLDPSEDLEVLEEAPIENGKDARLDLTIGAVKISLKFVSEPPDPSDPLKFPSLIVHCVRDSHTNKT